jgi:hypothetical protein
MPIGKKRRQATVMEGIMAPKAARLRPELNFQISISFERKL